MKSALLYGNIPFYLDHIAPFASILNIKLFVTEEPFIKTISKYYPETKVELANYNQVAQQMLSNSHTFIFSQLPQPLLKPLFLTEEALTNKNIIPFFLHHGQSDKDSLYGLKEEKLMTLYGNKMKDDLVRLGILNHFSHIAVTGNFRYSYFLKHKPFYTKLTNLLIPQETDKKNILYAPSWKEPSIQQVAPALIKNLPSNYHLYLKFHPNTNDQYPGFIDHLHSLCHKDQSITFVADLFPIYPLLSIIDIYLGDTSSIGYDFLTFNRPLYFIKSHNPLQKTTLLRCGKLVNNIDHFYKEITPQEELSTLRSIYYNYVYDKDITLTSLKSTIECICKKVNEDLLFFL